MNNTHWCSLYIFFSFPVCTALVSTKPCRDQISLSPPVSWPLGPLPLSFPPHSLSLRRGSVLEVTLNTCLYFYSPYLTQHIPVSSVKHSGHVGVLTWRGRGRGRGGGRVADTSWPQTLRTVQVITSSLHLCSDFRNINYWLLTGLQCFLSPPSHPQPLRSGFRKNCRPR